VAESAWVSEAAYVVGDVEIGENSSVWPGAVLRADSGGTLRIGCNTTVEDNCVLHAGIGDFDIGDRVVLGHGAVLDSTRIGNRVLIGMNATTLHHVEVGDDCVVAAGSVVAPGTKVPDGSFVAGVPGKIKGAAPARHQWWTRSNPEAYPDIARQYRDQRL